MKKDKILVVDSGFGGLYLFSLCISMLKEKMTDCPDFIYLMDNRNCPYGAKTKQEIEIILWELIEKEILLSTEIKLILLACNTATACAVKYLREKTAVPIVGIEPAVKPAAEKIKRGNILVMATPLTWLHANSILAADKSRMIPYCNSDLAKKIDENINNIEILTPYLTSELNCFKNKNIKGIVLGCTHYIYIKNLLQKNFPEAEFFLSEIATAKHFTDIVQSLNLKGKNKISFKSTKRIPKEKFSEIFKEWKVENGKWKVK